MSRPPRFRVVTSILAVAVAGWTGAARPLRADPPSAGAPLAAWEQEVKDETDAQTVKIERAKLTKTLPSVVSTYENRVGRDPSALNEYLLGRALYHAANPVGAKAAMERCLAADPKFYQAHLRLAILLLDLKNIPDAERHLRQVLAARPANAEALNGLAQIAASRQDWPAAVGLLNQRLAANPADVTARRSLASIYMETKDWPAARRELHFLLKDDQSNLGYRHMNGLVLLEMGEIDTAIAWLEAVVHEAPGSLTVLDGLRRAYIRKEDWPHVRSTLERMLPYLDEDGRKKATAEIQILKNGPPPPRSAAEAAPRKEITWDDILRFVEDPSPTKREDALIAIYDACMNRELRQVPSKVLRRITSDVEPSDLARATVVQILSTLAPEQVLPLMAVALYDESPQVRMLAAEAIGGAKQPVGLAYLFPFLWSDGMAVPEYQSVRDALSKITGFVDLPPGTRATTTAEDVTASREAWRRWRLSDGSDPIKRAAIAQLIEYKETSPEHFLYDFVIDPSFDVMSDAYRAMRTALVRPPRGPVELRTFPLFPSVPDAEVTRANMRSLQDRVTAWWTNYVTERRAYMKAAKPTTTPPGSGTVPPK